MIRIPFMGENFIFLNTHYFVDFLSEFFNEFPDQGVMLFSHDRKEFKKQKFDAIIMREGQIVAVRKSERKINGVYHNKTVARGRDDVARLVEIEHRKAKHSPLFVRTAAGFVEVANG